MVRKALRKLKLAGRHFKQLTPLAFVQRASIPERLPLDLIPSGAVGRKEPVQSSAQAVVAQVAGRQPGGVTLLGPGLDAPRSPAFTCPQPFTSLIPVNSLSRFPGARSDRLVWSDGAGSRAGRRS